MTEAEMIELIRAGYRLDVTNQRRGFRAPDAIEGDAWLWPPEAAYAHLLASRVLAEERMIAAALGGGYVEPLKCPDTLPPE